MFRSANGAKRIVSVVLALAIGIAPSASFAGSRGNHRRKSPFDRPIISAEFGKLKGVTLKQYLLPIGNAQGVITEKYYRAKILLERITMWEDKMIIEIDRNGDGYLDEWDAYSDNGRIRMGKPSMGVFAEMDAEILLKDQRQNQRVKLHYKREASGRFRLNSRTTFPIDYIWSTPDATELRDGGLNAGPDPGVGDTSKNWTGANEVLNTATVNNAAENAIDQKCQGTERKVIKEAVQNVLTGERKHGASADGKRPSLYLRCLRDNEMDREADYLQAQLAKNEIAPGRKQPLKISCQKCGSKSKNPKKKDQDASENSSNAQTDEEKNEVRLCKEKKSAAYHPTGASSKGDGEPTATLITQKDEKATSVGAASRKLMHEFLHHAYVNNHRLVKAILDCCAPNDKAQPNCKSPYLDQLRGKKGPIGTEVASNQGSTSNAETPVQEDSGNAKKEPVKKDEGTPGHGAPPAHPGHGAPPAHPEDKPKPHKKSAHPPPASAPAPTTPSESEKRPGQVVADKGKAQSDSEPSPKVPQEKAEGKGGPVAAKGGARGEPEQPESPNAADSNKGKPDGSVEAKAENKNVPKSDPAASSKNEGVKETPRDVGKEPSKPVAAGSGAAADGKASDPSVDPKTETPSKGKPDNQTTAKPDVKSDPSEGVKKEATAEARKEAVKDAPKSSGAAGPTSDSKPDGKSTENPANPKTDTTANSKGENSTTPKSDPSTTAKSEGTKEAPKDNGKDSPKDSPKDSSKNASVEPGKATSADGKSGASDTPKSSGAGAGAAGGGKSANNTPVGKVDADPKATTDPKAATDPKAQVDQKTANPKAPADPKSATEGGSLAGKDGSNPGKKDASAQVVQQGPGLKADPKNTQAAGKSDGRDQTKEGSKASARDSQKTLAAKQYKSKSAEPTRNDYQKNSSGYQGPVLAKTFDPAVFHQVVVGFVQTMATALAGSRQTEKTMTVADPTTPLIRRGVGAEGTMLARAEKLTEPPSQARVMAAPPSVQRGPASVTANAEGKPRDEIVNKGLDSTLGVRKVAPIKPDPGSSSSEAKKLPAFSAASQAVRAKAKKEDPAARSFFISQMTKLEKDEMQIALADQEVRNSLRDYVIGAIDDQKKRRDKAKNPRDWLIYSDQEKHLVFKQLGLATR